MPKTKNSFSLRKMMSPLNRFLKNT
jgi:hypothetical protein